MSHGSHEAQMSHMGEAHGSHMEVKTRMTDASHTRLTHGCPTGMTWHMSVDYKSMCHVVTRTDPRLAHGCPTSDGYHAEIRRASDGDHKSRKQAAQGQHKGSTKAAQGQHKGSTRARG